MNEKPYEYRELAYDLYKASDELLDKLVAMRKHRGMTQSDLADEMNVSQSYVSQIENGRKQLVSLLTDYALEVGARVEYVVEPAEAKPEGKRHYRELKHSETIPVMESWGDNNVTFGNMRVSMTFEIPQDDSGCVPKRIGLLVGGKPETADIHVQESAVAA